MLILKSDLKKSFVVFKIIRNFKRESKEGVLLYYMLVK